MKLPLDQSGRNSIWFLMTGGYLIEVISNLFSRDGRSAGFEPSKMLADKDANIVIGRQVGE
jgi:hypothetical protein